MGLQHLTILMSFDKKFVSGVRRTPKFDGAVETTRSNTPSMWVNRHGINRMIVSTNNGLFLSGMDIPKSDG